MGTTYKTWLLVCAIFIFVIRPRLHKWLMQNNTKVDVKIGSDLIFTSARGGWISGYCVCHKHKTVFRNTSNITRKNIRNFSKFIWDLELTLPPIIERDWKKKVKRFIIYKTIPVSEARRDALRGAEEGIAALLEKAGLAGAKILYLFIPFGVDLEELPALALSNSVVKYK